MNTVKDLLIKFAIDHTSAFITLVFGVVISPVVIRLLKIVKRHFSEWGDYIVNGFMYYISRKLRLSLISKITVKRYCLMEIKGSSTSLHVPSSQDIALDIDNVYVSLQMSHVGSEKEFYNHTDLLSLGNRIRVIGDPGSGKSSLVKRLFRDACRSAIKKPGKSRLPILLELRGLSVPGKVKPSELGDWLHNELRGRVAKSDVYKMEECFDDVSRTYGLLVLLDGLDEVSSKEYERVRDAILGLSEKLGHLGQNNAIVLTMRTQFHQQIRDDYQHLYPYVVSLKPFSPTDIYEFLTRWPFQHNKQPTISQIFNELSDKPTLRDMCSNPLILSMYVADVQLQGLLVSPETRTEFYTKVTEELLVIRRLRQTRKAIARAQIREQRQRILGGLAYNHLLDPEQPANSLRWSDAVRVAASVMKCTSEEAEVEFREIAKETGLVTEERTGESFRFIHLTFCEYFAAQEAIQGRRNGWRHLVEAHTVFQDTARPQLHSRLLEVIPFACGLLPRIGRSEAIDDLVRLADGRILGRAFLETKLYDHPGWSVFVTVERDKLMQQPEEAWDPVWLQNLHLFNVVVRDAEQSPTNIHTNEAAVDLEEFYRTLLTNQKGSLSALLTAYAAQDAAAAFRVAEICNLDLPTAFPWIVINSCDQKPYFALVQQRALDDTTRIKLWASLLAEAGLRSEIVGIWMSQIPPSPELETLIQDIPPKKRWYKTGLIERSFYTECLSIAVNHEINFANPNETMLARIQRSGIPALGSQHLATPSVLMLRSMLLVLASCGITLILMKAISKYISLVVLSGVITVLALILYYSLGKLFKYNYRLYLYQYLYFGGDYNPLHNSRYRITEKKLAGKIQYVRVPFSPKLENPDGPRLPHDITEQ